MSKNFSAQVRTSVTHVTKIHIACLESLPERRTDG